jgi:hypothetical protein
VAQARTVPSLTGMCDWRKPVGILDSHVLLYNSLFQHLDFLASLNGAGHDIALVRSSRIGVAQWADFLHVEHVIAADVTDTASLGLGDVS